MTAASETDLGVLHRLMAEQFRRLLAGEVQDADGNTVYPTAAELSVIRAFLKDNEITAIGEPGSALDTLRKKLAEAGGKPRVEAFDLPGSLQ